MGLWRYIDKFHKIIFNIYLKLKYSKKINKKQKNDILKIKRDK